MSQLNTKFMFVRQQMNNDEDLPKYQYEQENDGSLFFMLRILYHPWTNQVLNLKLVICLLNGIYWSNVTGIND